MHYYRYESAEVSCCYKYLMFSYNIIFWLAGAAFIAAGFWAWSEKGVLSDLTQVTRMHGFDPVWLVLVVGAVTFVLGFAGCVGALRENICLLKFVSMTLRAVSTPPLLLSSSGVLVSEIFINVIKKCFKYRQRAKFVQDEQKHISLKHYRVRNLYFTTKMPSDDQFSTIFGSFDLVQFSGIIGFIFFLELTAAVLAIVFQEPLKGWISEFFLANVKAYRDDIDLQNLIDSLQRLNHCCGAREPNDWDMNVYFNCSQSNLSRERCGVPFSCCLSDPADTVLNTQCGYDVRASGSTNNWSNTIHVKGCISALEEWLPRNIYIVAGIFIVISLLQMVGIYLARTLIGDIEKVKFNYY